MLRILFNAEESFKVVEYLNDEQGHSSAVKIAKNIDPFFYSVKINFYRITIIELYKLLKESEEYSIPNLLKKFRKQKEFESLSNKINLKYIENILEQLKDDIQCVFKIRNKHYAHLDKDFSNKHISIEIQKLRNLINQIEFIYNYFTKKLIESSPFNFNFPMGNPLESLESVMEIINHSKLNS